MERFEAWLEPINALADESPGFIWRLQDDEGDATSIRAFDDDRWLVNMSVWDSLEALRAFVLESDHVRVMRERARWFEPMDVPTMVLWWVFRFPLTSHTASRLSEVDVRSRDSAQRSRSMRRYLMQRADMRTKSGPPPR